MKKKDNDTNPPNGSAPKQGNLEFPGYLLYPTGEDIYNNALVDPDIDPENTTQMKSSNDLDSNEIMNEKDFDDDLSGDDLDVPGGDLDDEQEMIGSEDEENNYYSLGGDEHNDLDEDKGA
jgi:hypothetical protein